jgi:lysophospholipase L1-like esterase
MKTEAMTSTPETRSDLPLWKKVLFSAILLSILLVIGEFAAARLLRFTQGYDGEHLEQFIFDPYKNMHPNPGYADVRGIHHNRNGFRRSSDVERVKPAGTYRIFLMGASTAYGTGGLWPHIQRDYAVLDNSETIDAYLEKQLGEAFPGQTFEVINAGIPSTWTHHNLIYLNQTVLRYDPDMVLFLDGFNDFYFYDPTHDQFGDYAYTDHSYVIMGRPTVRSLFAANAWWFFRKSALVHAVSRSARNLKRLFSRPGERAPIELETAVASVEKVFRNNALAMMERSALIARHEGVIPVFMLQPLLILERERPGLTDIEKQMLAFNVESYLPGYEQFMHRAVPRLAAIEDSALADVGGEFIDLTSIFRDTHGQIFTDYAHLTPSGNEILASVVTERIRPLLAADLNADSAMVHGAPAGNALAGAPRSRPVAH